MACGPPPVVTDREAVVMRAFVVEKYAATGAVREVDVPEPDVGPHDVLVRVEAAGVNPLDSKTAAGELKLLVPHPTPFILGHDVAGAVTRVGSAVTRFAVGDAVMARPDDRRIGTFAELIAVREDELARTPASLTSVEAASLPLVALTAWQALVVLGDVRPGQKVLVHAGSGGVGTIAIQLAKHLGAEVATTTSTANVDLVRSLGADVAVDYRTDDFETVLSGYDLVIDPLGPDSVKKSLSVLRPGGLVVGLGGPPDPAVAARVGAHPVVRAAVRLISRSVRRTASRSGVRYSFLLMSPSGEQLAEIGRLVEAGVIRPVVDRVLPFDRTLEALALVDTGRVRGKVVVAMG
jgi:NADPH:quinone reductase-like Zn-dependent oxidoreductase